tara:strand:- start:2766 stop:4946 length:2181 start_codon:yes stop_codon:yes gene_type:complete
MALGQKEISLKIKADTKKFHDALKQLPGMTEKEAKKMARKMAREFNKAEKASGKSAKEIAGRYAFMFEKITQDNAKFQAALAGGMFLGAAAGLAKLANSASEYVDKVVLMSRQTGLTAETLIGLEFAAQAAGGNIDELKEGLNALTQKAGMASRKGGEAALIFKDIGVSVNDANGNLRSADDIFRDTINSLAGMTSTSDKASIALELFGGGGAKVAAILADGTGALDEYAAKAKEAGIVMDGDALKASANMDRAMADLKMTMRGVTQEAGEALIPAMVVIVAAIGKVIQQIAHAVDAFDGLTDSIFGNIEAGQDAQNTYVGQEKALNKVIQAAKDFDGQLKTTSGNMVDGATAARTLQLRIDHAEEAAVRLAQGYSLTASEQATLNRAMNEGRELAGQLGLDFDELAAGAKSAREEELALSQVDMSDLEGELNRLGKSSMITDQLGKGADQAAERLEALNRSFELEALARIDEPLAAFEKEMDRINAALEEGLDATLGQEAKLAAEAELQEARLEAALEVESKIQEAEQKRIDARLKAEEAAAMAAAQLQQEFFQGTQDLANNVFELAKSQRGITFQEEQALAIAQAIMNTAVGVTQELKKGVLGIPSALLIGAEGAIQIAAIKSQTMHAGGMVGGTPDEVPANLLRGEAVITRAGVDALGGEQAVNSINGGGGGNRPQVVVHQYKHRVLDVALKDQLRTDSNLNRALMGTGVFGLIGGLSRMGHR